MAEKLAGLNKTDTEDRMKLRASVTNSGSQTRGQMLDALYNSIKTAFDNDNIILFTARILFIYSSGDTYALRGQSYNATAQSISFLSEAVNGSGDTVMLNAVSIMPSGSKSLYCRINTGNNWNNLSDVSSNTDLQSVELYY